MPDWQKDFSSKEDMKSYFDENQNYSGPGWYLGKNNTMLAMEEEGRIKVWIWNSPNMGMILGQIVNLLPVKKDER